MINVVAALIWQNNKFLICQRPAYKARGLLWEFVGGKQEQGETLEQSLIRECKEELDITIKVNDIFMEVDHIYPDISIHLTLFNANIVYGVPRLLEHKALEWISPSEIPRFKFCPADKVILDRIIEKYKSI